MLVAGATLPADRLYAIENGPCGFDPADPKYFPKQRFLMLMRNERLATLRTDYEEASHTLTIQWEGREAARGDLRTPEGRLAIEAFFRRFMPAELRGAPKVFCGQGHSFSDVAKKVVSIINLASVAAVETASGARCIRCAFAAISMSRAGRPGMSSICSAASWRSARRGCKVVKRIVRCAATDVDPDTGIRDLTLARTLMESFGHAD